MSNRIEETERFRPLARHYMKALGEIAIEKDLDAAQMIACQALGSNPPTQVAEIADLIKALSRLTDNRHSDGVSSLVSPEDRGAIINGCYDLMVASRQAPAPLAGSQAAIDVAAERRRQVEAEGWTPAHDDKHSDRSMALAGACYAMFAAASDSARSSTEMPAGLTRTGKSINGWSAWLELWPWERQWWKPSDRRRDLVKAAALIIAEIERLDRSTTDGSAP
ncbi:hypothetical protein [Rhizobium leguminosarum]|uniref:hypothetical protein n=1 Tax=Rhizobium leguminosarum TaxID=384 RepID=UPI000369A7C3|nr:hypothetical protein [Rhizobium leguminosarum]